jgi:hypothetical protein
MLLQEFPGRHQIIQVIPHNLRPNHEDVLPPLADPADVPLDPPIALLDLQLAKDASPHILIVL